MERSFLMGLLLFSYLISPGQSSMIDKYKDSLNIEKTDTGKAIFLYKLSYYYQNYKPDSALLLAQSSYALSQKAEFGRGKTSSLGQMAKALNRLGNFPKALEYYLEQLKLLEKKKDPEDIASVYLSIALVYNSQQDAPHAVYYAHKADSIAQTNKLPELRLYTTLDIGDIYSNNNQLDSALAYTMLCYNESTRQGNDLITGTALNNMGNIYFKSGEYSRSLEKFKSSIRYLESMQDYNSLAECYLGLGQSFEKMNQPDSALYYVERSFHLASDNQFLKHAVHASNVLTRLYKQRNDLGHAFAFQQTYIALKDSFDNNEKIIQLQNLTISERLRQQQIAEQAAEEAKARHLKLELLLVGMCIPVLFFFSAFLTGKKVHRKLIEFSGIFAILFLFEYITLLLHPVVISKAGHSPVYEILIFVAIAAIISPSHHRIQTWLVNTLKKRHHNKIAAKPVKKGGLKQ
jgi:tetratricopeptide (TPR) repeat protein